MSVPALRAAGVSKRYGDVLALDRVGLSVHPGEVYALLGLNGAGKTTLMRVLLGMVRAGSGTVEVLGAALGRRRPGGAPWARVGHLVESASSYPELTVRENLRVTARLRRLGAAGGRAVDDVVAQMGLGPWVGTRARDLSLGNAQRLGLAAALVHRPDLLLLDEPVNGLDPAGVVEVRALLADLAHDGCAVLVSSHLIGEVGRIATRVGVLHRGRLVDELDAGALDARLAPRLEVSARDAGAAEAALRAGGFDPVAAGGVLVLTAPGAVRRPDAVATALVRAGAPPTGLALVHDDLESWFLGVVGAAGPGVEEAVGAR